MMKFKLEIFIYQDLIERELFAKHKYNKRWIEFRYIGKVIDETKNTIIVKKKGEKIKTYVKNQYYFRCWLNSGKKEFLIEFDGNKAVGTPAEKIKKIKKFRRKLH